MVCPLDRSTGADFHPSSEVMAAAGGDVDDAGDDPGDQVSRFARRKAAPLQIVVPFNSVSYHVPPDQPTLSAGAARPSTGSIDDSLSHRPSSRRGAGPAYPHTCPLFNGRHMGRRQLWGSMVRFSCALVCVCWFHACVCCVRAVSSGGGYQGVLQPGRAAPAGGLRCLAPFNPLLPPFPPPPL